ncbi:MAG: BMP family ABC transporter substrate-binding protein [Firmicutes bacterium HGW-Firmicutes-16]|nr:MAG: BMP family ABC transporter substrate-binding protein [Firmicutes bacterium HGW-Firmicutes-16]
MKKVIALLLALTLVFALAACTAKNPEASPSAEASATPSADAAAVKIGVILVHDENTGYDAAHIEGIKKAAATAGIADDQIVWKYNVGEDEGCYDTATDLVEQGCTYIFSDSYGHQSYMQQAASENADVTFVSMTGDTAALSKLPNFKNAFTHTFESRYVSGVVAGMKLKELVDAGTVAAKNKNADGTIKIGYVGAYPYAEVVSGYTAFYLGVKSIVENVAMTVSYTNSWYDPTAEAEAANQLISAGCIILSQHADSTGAPSACEAALKSGTAVYCIGYNVDMLSVAPTSALTSSQNDWSVYYTYAFNCALKGEDIATDWSEGYATGANMISALGASCAAGTDAKVAEVEAALKDGTLNIFDCSKFTVDGAAVTTYLAIDTDGDWVGDTGEAIANGVFSESTLRSAPYFGLRIDGITELTK